MSCLSEPQLAGQETRHVFFRRTGSRETRHVFYFAGPASLETRHVFYFAAGNSNIKDSEGMLKHLEQALPNLVSGGLDMFFISGRAK